MGTSNAKAMRRFLKGTSTRARLRFAGDEGRSGRYAKDPIAGTTRRPHEGSANLRVSASGRSTRGLSASVPSRVSHAKRVRKTRRDKRPR